MPDGRTADRMDSAARRRRMSLGMRLLLICVGALFLGSCDGPDTSIDPSNYETSLITDCFNCQLVELAYNAVSQMGGTAYAELAEGSLGLLGLGLGFSLALSTAKVITAMSDPDIGAYWKDVAARCGWAIFAGAFLLGGLSTGRELMNITLAPVIELAVGYGGQVLGGVCAADMVWDSAAEPLSGNNLLPPGPLEGITCIIKQMNGLMINCIFLGLKMMIMPLDISGLLGGVLMVGTFMWLLIIFPLYIFDPVLRFGLITVLSPLLVVAWVFKSTRKYVTAAMKVAVNSAAMIVILCVILAVITNMVNSQISSTGQPIQTLAQINGAGEELLENFELYSTNFWGLMMAAFFGIMAIDKTSKTAAALAPMNKGTAGAAVGAMKLGAAVVQTAASLALAKLSGGASKALEQTYKQTAGNAKKAAEKANNDQE